jgi:outer membrane protein assembly factor BamE (lipoprotein component of BamABCDE complex)
MKTAIENKKAVEGMTRDQVVMALGRPDHKDRETKDGIDYEDWIYGVPPGKVTFVTFAANKVVKVKETYAGLGGSIAQTPKQ